MKQLSASGWSNCGNSGLIHSVVECYTGRDTKTLNKFGENPMQTPASVVILLLVTMLFAAGCSGGATAPASAQKSILQMDPYLERLFTSPNDFQLVERLVIRISADGRDEELERLPKAQKVLFEVNGAEGVIRNGGFQYLFEADLADFAGIADSYDAIGANESAEVIREALSLFPNSRPHEDVDQRLEYLGCRDPGIEKKLEALSERIWARSRDTDHKLAAFVRANKGAFADLPPSRWEDLEELKKQDLPPPDSDASEEEVQSWLESIDARCVRKVDTATYAFSEFSLPSEGNPIVVVELSHCRNSTDTELESLSKLKCLTELRQLKVSESYISKAGMSFVSRLGSLENLELAETDLTDDWLERLSTLHKLQRLDVSRSQITDTGLAYLARVPSLKSISLDHTRISDAGLQHFESLVLLTTLELRSTKVTGAGFVHFNPASLRNLYLMEAGVTDDGLSSLGRLKELRTLDLSETSAGDVAVKAAAGCDKLEVMYLTATNVSDTGLQPLGSLVHLKHLNLDLTAISGESLGFLSKMHDIENLSFYRTPLTDEGLLHFRGLSKLKSLSLANTRITDRGLSNLSGLLKLKSLDLTDTNITEQGIRALEPLTLLEYLSLPKSLKGSGGAGRLQKLLPESSFSFD